MHRFEVSIPSDYSPEFLLALNDHKTLSMVGNRENRKEEGQHIYTLVYNNPLDLWKLGITFGSMLASDDVLF